MKVILSGVRLSFAKIWRAEQVNGQGKPKFSASFIIDPKSANAKILREACIAVAKDKFGAKWETIFKELKKTDKVCYREGPKTNQSGEVYEGYAGMHFVNASSETRPAIRDRDKSQLTEEDGKPYSGCYVNAILDIWPQDNQFGKRVNATLKGLQFVKDGDAFSGGAPVTEEDFEDLADTGEESETEPIDDLAS